MDSQRRITERQSSKHSEAKFTEFEWQSLFYQNRKVNVAWWKVNHRTQSRLLVCVKKWVTANAECCFGGISLTTLIIVPWSLSHIQRHLTTYEKYSFRSWTASGHLLQSVIVASAITGLRRELSHITYSLSIADKCTSSSGVDLVTFIVAQCLALYSYLWSTGRFVMLFERAKQRNMQKMNWKM